MLRRIVTILLSLPLVLLEVAAVVFLSLRVIPGDPASQYASQGVGIGPHDIERIRGQLGLGQPLPVQFATYVGKLVRLDFGDSFYSGTSVASQIGRALPATIELTCASVAVMLGFGLIGGLVAVHFKDTWLDLTLRGIATIMLSVPWFSLGIILILVFSVRLGWFPTFNRLPSDLDYRPVTGFVGVDAIVQGRYDWLLPWLEHLALPALTLGLVNGGFMLRVTRASFLEMSGSDFVTTARAKGMTEMRVLTHHISRNAAVPIVTVLGLLVGTLLGGAVVTEVVFAYPGMGQLLVQAILQRDFPVAEGAAITIAAAYVLINGLTDVAYVVIDPRLRRR